MKSVLVTIASTEKRESAALKQVRHALDVLGVKDLECARVSAVYRLEGPLPESDLRKVCDGLLRDPIVEESVVNEKPASASAYFADVWFKPGVTDAVGDSVLKAVKDLGVGSVERAFAGTRYAFSTSSANSGTEKKILEFAGRQLLNPLVQECKILRAENV